MNKNKKNTDYLQTENNRIEPEVSDVSGTNQSALSKKQRSDVY